MIISTQALSHSRTLKFGVSLLRAQNQSQASGISNVSTSPHIGTSTGISVRPISTAWEKRVKLKYLGVFS